MRNYSICVLSGIAASLSLPPVGLVPALLFFSPAFYLAATAVTARQAMLYSGLSAWGWFIASVYWVGSSLFVAGGVQLLLLPVVCLLFPLFLALFWAAAAGLVHLVLSSPSARLFGLIAGFGCADYLRSVLLTGFPWNVTGHAFLGWLPLAQGASVVGQHGLNFLALSFIIAFVFLVRRQVRLAFVSLLPVLVSLGLSVQMTGPLPALERAQDQGPVVRLIQPNIPQKDKWDRDKRGTHLQRMISLAKEQDGPAVLTVLPEAALASVWPREPGLVKNMAALIAGPSGMMATGMLRRNEKGELFNSVLFVDAAGQIHHIYDKQHLVPFGEYVPVRGLPFIDVIAGKTDIRAGGEARPLDLPGLGQIRVLICYEVIFPDFIASDRQRPDVILTLSNDAWFGQTTGPHQHFAQARLRAIEEGLPVIRVANTGISGVIDSYGRVLASSDLGTAQTIDSIVPRSRNTTLYSQIRLLAPLVLLAGYLLMCFWLEICAQRRNKNQ